MQALERLVIHTLFEYVCECDHNTLFKLEFARFELKSLRVKVSSEGKI